MDDRVKQLEQLSAYLDGELTAEQALDLERALAEDAELAAELESLRKTRQLLRDLPVEPAPAEFTRNVMARSRRLHPVAREGVGGALPASRWISFATAAIVLIAAGAGLYIIVNSPPDAPHEQLATAQPEPSPAATTAVAVADLPMEHIFTADLPAARQDVTDVLARNGVAMADYVQVVAWRDALEAPVGGSGDRMSQTVQVAADTVEIEVLVAPGVAKQILMELADVQGRQLAMAAETGSSVGNELESLAEAPAGGLVPVRPADAPDELRSRTREPAPLPADEAPAVEQPAPPTASAPGVDSAGDHARWDTTAAPEATATGAAEPPVDTPDTTVAEEESQPESRQEAVQSASGPAMTDADKLASSDERRYDQADEPPTEDDEHTAAGRTPGRPWFGEDPEPTDAAEPDDPEIRSVAADGDEDGDAYADPGHDVIPGPADRQAGQEVAAEYGLSWFYKWRLAGSSVNKRKDEPMPPPPADVADSGELGGAEAGRAREAGDHIAAAEGTVEASPPAPAEGAQLQRLVIVLQQVPAEQLPSQIRPRSKQSQPWRRASRWTGD